MDGVRLHARTFDEQAGGSCTRLGCRSVEGHRAGYAGEVEHRVGGEVHSAGGHGDVARAGHLHVIEGGGRGEGGHGDILDRGEFEFLHAGHHGGGQGDALFRRRAVIDGDFERVDLARIGRVLDTEGDYAIARTHDRHVGRLGRGHVGHAGGIRVLIDDDGVDVVVGGEMVQVHAHTIIDLQLLKALVEGAGGGGDVSRVSHDQPVGGTGACIDAGSTGDGRARGEGVVALTTLDDDAGVGVQHGRHSASKAGGVEGFDRGVFQRTDVDLAGGAGDVDLGACAGEACDVACGQVGGGIDVEFGHRGVKGAALQINVADGVGRTGGGDGKLGQT